MAAGLLEIVDTTEGERMRFRATRHAPGLAATVKIDRLTASETLELFRIADHTFQSAKGPAEPHQFLAQLELTAGGASELLPFEMTEPNGHRH